MSFLITDSVAANPTYQMLSYFCRAAALLIPVSLVSCFGGAVVRSNPRVMARFNLEKSVRVIHGGNPGANPTGKEIKAIWGEPNSTTALASDTVWTYDTKPGVTGVVPIYFLPLPLLVPTKSDGIDFYFREQANRPYQAIERSSGITGGYYDSSDGTFGKVAH